MKDDVKYAQEIVKRMEGVMEEEFEIFLNRCVKKANFKSASEEIVFQCAFSKFLTVANEIGISHLITKGFEAGEDAIGGIPLMGNYRSAERLSDRWRPILALYQLQDDAGRKAITKQVIKIEEDHFVMIDDLQGLEGVKYDS